MSLLDRALLSSLQTLRSGMLGPIFVAHRTGRQCGVKLRFQFLRLPGRPVLSGHRLIRLLSGVVHPA